MTGTPAQVARHFHKDPATIRRWIAAGCPVLRHGRKGPGQSAILDFEQVEHWRGQSVQAEPDVDAILQRIAESFLMALEQDKVDLKAGVDKTDAAAVLIAVFDRCAQSFGRIYRYDQVPDAIRALMREL